MRKLAVLAVGSAMAFAATATEWYWVQGSTDWTSPSSYTNATGGAGVPQSGDEVAIPKDVTAVLTAADLADAYESAKPALEKAAAADAAYEASEGGRLTRDTKAEI